MMRSPAFVVHTALLTAFTAVAVAQELPTRAFVPAQAGSVADGAARPADVTLYRPGRVLVQVTAEALDATVLPRRWEGGDFEPFAGSGLAALDAVLFDAGAAGVTRSLIDAADEVLARELGMDRWYAVEVDPEVEIRALAERLRALPEVEDASPDWRAFPMDVPNDPLHPDHWGHHNTGQFLSYCLGCGGHPGGSPVGTIGFDANAQVAWDAPGGHGNAGIVIGIIDSGVDVGHPDLRQVAGWDYGDNDSNADDDSAQQGHGTACAGVAAAINGNGLGTAGVAGGCSIMPLKVANSAGSMFFSAIANAITHAADNGADIASLSLGASVSNDSQTSSAISYAHANGVTILAATANSNASTLAYPANNQLVIGVGAAAPCGERKRSSSSSGQVNPGVSTDPNGVTCDNETWWGSNYGTNVPDAAGAVDVIAPTILPTTDIQGSAGYASGNYSLWFNGTSCATPYAAGVCALILANNPGFTPDQVRSRLVSTAADVVGVESGVGWDRYTGYGMVDAAAAVGGGSPPPPPPAGPTYATLPYATGFEGGLDASWTTLEGAEGRVLVTGANGPFAGGAHLTMDDSVNGGAFSLNEAWLHLDLAGQTQVDLEFRWKEFGDETHAQDGVYVSDDGGASFAKVLDLNGGSTADNTWQLAQLDLDALAAGAGVALSSTFVVKFQQYDNYAIATDGFAFDAIEVTAGSSPPPPPSGPTHAPLPYATGFESGTLDASWTVAEGVEGRIEVSTANGPAAGSYHLVMDDAVSAGAFSQNEAWLHLDLAGETQVALDFRWKDIGDETHAQDGVFFSDDGGASFVKVHALNGGATPNNVWQTVALDLDALAAAAGLALNGSFVVKFQQYDNYPVASDGFCFDEVSVAAGSGGGGDPTRAQKGYATGFESGALDAFWSTFSSPEGRILVTTANTPASGAWHLTMDDSLDGSAYGLNEAWLDCDFSGEAQVSLSFRWKDFAEETHTQDGVFFSDDDGATFVKVHALNGGSTANNTWQTVVLDVDALAASNGLALNGSFVIKFQQYDNFGISTDGLAFDEIAIN